MALHSMRGGMAYREKAEKINRKNEENIIYIHEKIMRAVLPLIAEYDLELIDLIGELNHAAWSLSVLNKAGIEKLIAELNKFERCS